MVFSGEAAWEKKWKSLLLGEKGSESPGRELTILSKRAHNKQGKKGFALRVEGVSDRNAAEELIGCPVFIPEDFLVSKKGEAIYLREILNFEVIDAVRGSVGTISGFSDNGAQDLIVISDNQKKQSEVPLVKPLLERIDFENEKVFMDIPVGLLAGEDQ